MDFTAFLASLRGRLRRVLALEGTARLIIATVVAIATAVAIDFAFHLPGWLRVGALATVAVVVGLVAWRRLRRPLSRSMDDGILARLTERRLPELSGRLLSGVEGLPLTDEDRTVLTGSLSSGTLSRLVPASALPRQLGMATLVIGIAAVMTLLIPEQLSAGLRRLFLPLGDTEWARTSSIEVEVERPVVPDDEPVVLSISRPRGGEGTVRLTWIDTDRRLQETRLVEGSVGAIARRVPLNLTPGRYRIAVESGDAHVQEVEARVVARPRLASIKAILKPPGYIAQEPQHLSTLACTALPGSELSFEIVFDMEVDRLIERQAMMLGDVSIPVEPITHGFRGRLLVERGGEILLAIADQDGIGPRPEPRFTMTVIEDHAPEVRLEGPRSNEAISPRAVVTVRVDARDDHGLATVQLLRSVILPATDGENPDQTPKEEIFVDFPGISGLATTRPHTLEVGTLAKIGQRLVLVGLAKDANDVNGPGIGRSEPLVLRVVSDDDLRQDLDRQLVEALERVRQSREDLGKGLTEDGQLAPSARSAALTARKAAEMLKTILRRSQDNRLDQEQIDPVAKAEDLVGQQALPALAESGSNGEEAPARKADQALADAERLLQGMRQEGDLARQLAYLLAMERNLTTESKALVKEYLVKKPDAAGDARFTDLSTRQRALSDQLRDLERRLLAATGEQLEEAKELVRQEQPADLLAQAGTALGELTQRARAPGIQDQAIDILERLLQKLRGNDADRALAERAGELADLQEQLAKELDRGTDPKSLEKRQRDLKRRTEDLQRQVEQQSKDQEAKDNLKGATNSQEEAAEAMGKGSSRDAGREASAAAAQLREAQRRLQGDEPEQPDEKDAEGRKVTDVLRLLRELRTLQVKVVTGSDGIYQRLAEAELDFAGKRDLEPLSELQEEILLRLREEGIKALDQLPIAARALARVAEAMDRANTHLARPALGSRGMLLVKTALQELNRLIDVVDHMPQGKQGDGGKPNPDGKGQPSPFPPEAELALLAAIQEDLARKTVAGTPGDLTSEQKELLALVDLMRQSIRPGSRPGVLLDRTSRAMASAGYQLGQADRGILTRHEQDLAVATLRRILEEAESGGGGGSSSSSSSQQQRRPGKPSPAPGEPGSESPGNPQGGSPGGAAQGTPAPGGKTEPAVTVEGMAEGALLHLPPERREQLLEALRQDLPPGSIPLFQRYLELLEDAP